MNELKFSISEEKKIFVAGFSGEINPGTEEVFGNHLSLLSDQACEKNKHIIIDFQGLEYINSTGLGVIAQFYKKCSEKKVRVIICGLSSMCSRLFEITKLDHLFEILPSLNDARSALSC
ncbi:MAG: STAS domain-containing protein [Candidatus Wallbacteria bacterium]|nr:STAS domain-containing protein [Candidatus Wallbacteria bacterium]